MVHLHLVQESVPAAYWAVMRLPAFLRYRNLRNLPRRTGSDIWYRLHALHADGARPTLCSRPFSNDLPGMHFSL